MCSKLIKKKITYLKPCKKKKIFFIDMRRIGLKVNNQPNEDHFSKLKINPKRNHYIYFETKLQSTYFMVTEVISIER